MKAIAKFNVFEQENTLFIEPGKRRQLAALTIERLSRLGYQPQKEVNGVVVLVPPLGADMSNRELMIDYRIARDRAQQEVTTK